MIFEMSADLSAYSTKGTVSYVASVYRRRGRGGKSIHSGHKGTVNDAIMECVDAIGRCRLKEGDYISVSEWTSTGDGGWCTSISLLTDDRQSFSIEQAKAIAVETKVAHIQALHTEVPTQAECELASV